MRIEKCLKSLVPWLLAVSSVGLVHAAPGTIGQIWFGAQGPAITTNGVSDDRIGHVNSDGSAPATATTSPTTNSFYSVGLDTNANLYFALGADGTLTSGYLSVTALPHSYSGISLSGLNYLGDPGDAEYVPGTTPVAQLFTKDAGEARGADKPAVFIPGPFGTLGTFSATYSLQSSAVPAGTTPYWVLLVNPPGDSNPNDEVAIIQYSTGTTLNSSSTIHVVDPKGKLGSYFGDSLATLNSTSLGTYTFGDMTVDWAGVEIGNWGVGDTNTAKVQIKSMTLTFLPAGTLDTVQITDVAANDLAYSLGVDPDHDIVYIGLWGADANGADMIEVTYNPANGQMISPYDPSSGSIIDESGVLMSFVSTGFNFVMAREMWVAPGGGQIYYADNDFGDPGDFALEVKLNGIYVVDTTDPDPQPQLLSLDSQFPGDNSQGYIVGMAVNQPKSLIYFVTAGAAPGVGTASNTIWSMPIAGGAATPMPMPSGVSLVFPNDAGGCLALDAASQILYVSDEGQGTISKLTLSAAGTNFTSGAKFFTLDSQNLTNGPNHFPSAFVRGLEFLNETVISPPPPSGQLTITQQGTNAIVSWPVQYSSSILQSSPVLTPNASWSTYPGPFGTNATVIMATNGISGKARFFRLSN
jgi:hypothetical protein